MFVLHLLKQPSNQAYTEVGNNLRIEKKLLSFRSSLVGRFGWSQHQSNTIFQAFQSRVHFLWLTPIWIRLTRHEQVVRAQQSQQKRQQLLDRDVRQALFTIHMIRSQPEHSIISQRGIIHVKWNIFL